MGEVPQCLLWRRAMLIEYFRKSSHLKDFRWKSRFFSQTLEVRNSSNATPNLRYTLPDSGPISASIISLARWAGRRAGANPSLRVVHLGRSTCHAISGRGCQPIPVGISAFFGIEFEGSRGFGISLAKVQAFPGTNRVRFSRRPSTKSLPVLVNSRNSVRFGTHTPFTRLRWDSWHYLPEGFLQTV